MMIRAALAVIASLILASAEIEWTEGESLMDDDAPAAGSGPYESLMDDEAPPPEEPDPREITFGTGSEFTLTTDIIFDEQGNVQEGGSVNPDIAFWHVAEFNGQRINEPTDGSTMLLEALQSGTEYVVKLAPPDLSRLKCNEKVENLNVVLDRDWHDMDREMLNRALETLASEGVFNTKQLGELWEKDYDAIKIPAIIKSRLRIAREEAQRQAATAGRTVAIDSKEVEDELREFMAARKGARGEATSTPEKTQAASAASGAAAAGEQQAPVVEEEEEDGTFKSLVWAIMNCPTCKGKETIACLQNCRYPPTPTGEKAAGEPTPWGECLDQCVTNLWIRSTFKMMLPR